jgi:hypothetical protein
VSFFHVNSWIVEPGSEEPHGEMIRTWFRYVEERREAMFGEWLGATHFAKLDDSGEPTGRYVMLFEFYSAEAHATYKERRKDFTGPYEEYRKIDPYQFFVKDSITHRFWEPRETALWHDFRSPGAPWGVMKVETWETQSGRAAEHDELIRSWFAYVGGHRPELFREWQGARYYEEVEIDGASEGHHSMLFAFESQDAANRYYERRKGFTGPYAEYKRTDPYETFVKETVASEWWEPRDTDLWLDFRD